MTMQHARVDVSLPAMPKRSERLNLVLTPDERALLDAAAEELLQPLSVIVRATMLYGLGHIDQAMADERTRRAAEKSAQAYAVTRPTQ